MDIRRMDFYRHRKSQCIDHDMLFSALYLLVPVYASLTVNMMGCLDTP